jgi:hypothetical protein
MGRSSLEARNACLMRAVRAFLTALLARYGGWRCFPFLPLALVVLLVVLVDAPAPSLCADSSATLFFAFFFLEGGSLAVAEELLAPPEAEVLTADAAEVFFLEETAPCPFAEAESGVSAEAVFFVLAPAAALAFAEATLFVLTAAEAFVLDATELSSLPVAAFFGFVPAAVFFLAPAEVFVSASEEAFVLEPAEAFVFAETAPVTWARLAPEGVS